MRVPLWVNGEKRESNQTEIVTNPYDGSPVAEVCLGGEQEMDDAIEASIRVFKQAKKQPIHEREGILRRAAQALLDAREELARCMVAETGKPIRYARGEVDRASLTFSLGGDVSRRENGTMEQLDIAPSGEGRMCMHQRVPRGPVAAIAPFNFPLNLAVHKVSPAVAVGTSMVLKPAAQAPLTALRMASLLHDAGVLPGSVNVVHCLPDVAERMVVHPGMRVLSFTGSPQVGWHLKSIAGQKQVLLELGGNAPVVIDEGVEVDSILERLLMGAWANAGQVCIKAQRIYVHRSLYEEVLHRFIEATRGVVCGDPMAEDTMVGPLIESGHRDRVLSWVKEAVSAGARLECGGEADGNVVFPTILTGVDASMRVVRDEVFGPVTTVTPFSSFDEVLQTCNQGPYGLQAGVFTSNVEKAFKAFDELDFGGVMINDVPTFRVDNFPYGGTKSSGLGREGVRYAAEDYTEPKILIFRR